MQKKKKVWLSRKKIIVLSLIFCFFIVVAILVISSPIDLFNISNGGKAEYPVGLSDLDVTTWWYASV